MDIGQKKQYKPYLNGQWITTDEEIEVVNPGTEQVFARVSTICSEHIQMALHAAEAAFQGWRGRTAKERGTLLHRVADHLKNVVMRLRTP